MLRVRQALLASSLLALTACTSSHGTTPSRPDGTSSSSASASAVPLTFLEDDYAQAEKQAKDEGKLLFVDVWAPWCHTCLAMRHGVFDAPALGPRASDFVFASLDGDKDENADFLARFPMKVWPTFFVIDPADRSLVAMYGGSFSLPELQAFLAGAKQAHDGTAGADGDLARALKDAHAAFAARTYAKALPLYETATARPWARRNEAFIGVMRAAIAAGDFPKCGAFGAAHLGDVTGASSQADFIDALRSCAATSTDPDAKKRILELTLDRLRKLASSPPGGASIDDRADLLSMLAEAEAATGNAAGVKDAHTKRIDLLDAAAASAGSPDAARVFDYARMGSYLALGRADEAVKMFEARVKDFPDSYEAWARYASTLHAVSRDKDALTAVDKAIVLSYGPRHFRYLGLRAEIQAALGDLDGAVKSIEEEAHGYEGLPAGQLDDVKIKDAKKRLQAAKDARDSAGHPGAKAP